jgi:polyisoprenyl-teichoic acid--peptidoglycan teichoic acid transferase
MEGLMKRRKLKVLNLTALSASVLTLLSLLYNQFLPSLIRWPLFLLVILYTGILIIRKLPKVVIIVITVALFLTSTLLIYSQYAANRLFDYIDKELNTISFVVLKDHPALTLNDVKKSSFVHSAYFDKEALDYLSADVKSRFEFTPAYVSVASDIDAYTKLLEKEVEVFILDNAFWELVVEHDSKFESKVRVIHTVDKETDKEDIVKNVEVDKDAFIVLISGNDNYGSLYQRARSDVNMLVIVNPTKGEIMTVSLPRDSFVPLACKNKALDKLTHAGIYGVNCTVTTIEKFIGIDINYYVRLNFTAFLKIVDVIGDISVNNPRAFTSWLGTYFPKGTLKLDSALALQFARERKSFENGDADRTLNQQEVIRSIIKKMATPASVLKVEQIIKVVSKSLDTNVSSDVISKLVKLQLEKNIDWKFSSAQLRGTYEIRETFSIPGANLNVYRVESASIVEVKDKIIEFMKVSE